MLALKYYKKNDMRLEDVPIPEAGKGEVRIKVGYAAICGTDIEEYLYGPLWVSQDEPHPLTGKKAPLSLGHELSGYIDEVGEGVDQFNIGDRVAVYPIIYCGECDNCKKGNYEICKSIGCVGLSMDGGFEEYCVIPARNVFKVPDNVKLEHAALTEPVGFCTNTLALSDVQLGDDVIVFGAGGIGLICTQIAKAAGAKNVIVIARNPLRLQAAKDLGADYVFDVTKEGYLEKVMEITNGNGADVVIEATGSIKVIDQVFEVSKVGGTITLASVFFEDATFDLKKIVNAGRKVIGAVAHKPIHFQQALKMMSDGRVNVAPMAQSIVPLKNAIEDGFKEYINNKKNYIKMIIKP